MMYTIDLLQGGGLPRKSHPGKVALAIIPVLIPLLTSGLMAAGWKHKETLITAESDRVENDREQLKRYQHDLDLFRLQQRRILEAQHQLRGVNKLLSTEMAVSPVVLELVRVLPESVFFQQFELQHKQDARKVEDEKTGKQETQHFVMRTLLMNLVGPNRIESDEAINGYIQDLRDNPVLKDLVQEIRIVSREPGRLDDLNQVFYKVECQLKEQKSEVL